LALAIMTSEFELAEVHARNGFQLVEKTGAANEYVVNQANSGFLWHSLGRLEDAVECYERALALMTPGSEVYRGTLDSLARVRLAQGRLDDCETLLAKVNSRRLHQEDRPTYVNRHQLLTRAKLAMARRDPSAAARILDEALRAAEFAGDELLVALSLLGQVDVAIMNGDMSGIVGRLERVTPLLRGQGELFARYERAIGEVEFSNGNQMAAFDHLRRSSRLHEGLHHVQGLSELHQSSYWPGASSSTFKPSSSIPAALHSVVTMLSNSQHPEFLAREFVTLLGAAGVSRAVAISRCSRGLTTVLAQYTEPGQGTGNKKTIRIGQINGKTIEVLIEFANDIESLATVNSGASLISQTVELEHARADRRERATTWPIDEVRSDANGVVLGGQMRELFVSARRVAGTKINVLITGESGTGKEIIARAIHEFSDRAQKPFVPLNCAAVPRDLLESQLFGYRRGAFTGADRDQLGLVRYAAGGTLFLDEIGDMSLELQPKLLRFLESGEITPLGEPSPLLVDVRVVAATNSNLEDAMRNGKFREDLFYRLNVVRLNVRPLRDRRDEIPGMVRQFVAQAARDFKKGYLEVAEAAMEKLILYRWPGNVRQLQNEIRRMVALAEPDSILEYDAISPEILSTLPSFQQLRLNGAEIAIPLQDKLKSTLDRVEFEMIKAALKANHGRLEPAAKSLGISRKGLYLKRQRLGL